MQTQVTDGEGNREKGVGKIVSSALSYVVSDMKST